MRVTLLGPARARGRDQASRRSSVRRPQGSCTTTPTFAGRAGRRTRPHYLQPHRLRLPAADRGAIPSSATSNITSFGYLRPIVTLPHRGPPPTSTASVRARGRAAIPSKSAARRQRFGYQWPIVPMSHEAPHLNVETLSSQRQIAPTSDQTGPSTAGRSVVKNWSCRYSAKHLISEHGPYAANRRWRRYRTVRAANFRGALEMAQTMQVRGR